MAIDPSAIPIIIGALLVGQGPISRVISRRSDAVVVSHVVDYHPPVVKLQSEDCSGCSLYIEDELDKAVVQLDMVYRFADRAGSADE